MSMNSVQLAQALIRFASVTPKDEGVQQYLADYLSEAGFTCHHLPFGSLEIAPEHLHEHAAEDIKVHNLFARFGTEEPHLCYGGHTDVVPPGPTEQWSSNPFAAEIRDGILYGRGASDMKGSVACFAAAAVEFVQENPDFQGSISLLITGDEEGPAVNGTVKVLEWMKENGHVPDVAIVGEPTNPSVLGEEIKVGRRGSFNGFLRVKGKQGHVAYQHLADNPIPAMAKMLDALARYEFDKGSDHFAATNLEITSVDVGNNAENIIPGEITAMFNIRFNDHWASDSLEEKVREILDDIGGNYTLETRCGAESFITEPGAWSDLVGEAVEQICERKPEITTSGGTSDARFISQYCPTVEFGPINESIHKIDENSAVQVLEDLTQIYKRILELYFRVK